MKQLFYIILSAIIIIYACSKSDNITDPITPADYIRIFTAQSGNISFEVWSKTASFFVNGYNDIGFKVFENNQEKTSGFVNFYPKMYHGQNSPSHSSPVSSQFIYDNGKQLFSGYACFTMLSDSSSFWYGFFNYNDTLRVDSVFFQVNSISFNQMILFDDMIGGYYYFLTLVQPQMPKQGINTLQCMLHRSINNDSSFYQMDSVEMYIKPWMETMGHGSPNNVNPVFIGNGIYEGKANFNMSGNWTVYDSIYYQNRWITPAGDPPKFGFSVP